VLVSGAKLENTHPPADEFVRDVAAALGAVGCEERLRQCFSLRLKMPSLHLQAEAEQFGHRLLASGHAISGLSAKRARSGSRNIPSEIDVRIEPLVMPRGFAAGQRAGVNVRITNKGPCSLSSRGEPPLTLSYRWRKRRDLRRFWRPAGVPAEGCRTSLLAEIGPGGVITQPIFIEAPSECGTYHLEFAVVLETVRWYLDCGPIHRCEVKETALKPNYTQNFDGPALSYMEQHQYGIDLLNKWISCYVQTKKPTIIEIGGNYNAATEAIGCDANILNIDVDLHALMARNIVKGDNIISIVADGMNIPVEPRSVDAIVLFATFHHFPEPIKLLSSLKSKLKKGGLICLMCEPIGHVAAEHNYTAYIEELEKGVCEQSFEIWEYETFLKAAGLRIAEAVFDRGAAMIAARV
jgi:hypothetical protein